MKQVRAPPAGELIGFVLTGLMEVQAELCINADAKVVVHLYDLQQNQTGQKTRSRLHDLNAWKWATPWAVPGSCCPCHLHRFPGHPAGWSIGPSEPRLPRPQRPRPDTDPRRCNQSPTAEHEPDRYLTTREPRFRTTQDRSR